MRNTVCVDMTQGGTVTAWDSFAENRNTINLLIHTGGGTNPRVDIENRSTTATITGFDLNAVVFCEIPAQYYPEYSETLDNNLYIRVVDDTQRSELIAFTFHEDMGGQMSISKIVGEASFVCVYQNIMTDAEANQVIQEAQTTIQNLPTTIQTEASTANVANNVNSFNLDGVFESIITNIKPIILKKVNDAYVYVNTPPSNGIRNYIEIKQNYIRFIEFHLPTGSSFSEANTTLFTLGGQQVYYTSIEGSSAYKNLTFTSPTVLNGATVNVDDYKVRYPTPTATYVKSQYQWEYDSTLQSYTVSLLFGAGDGSGNGVATFSKVGDLFEFFYKSRTLNGAKFGFAMDDNNAYNIYKNVNFNTFNAKEYPTLANAQADSSLPDGVFALIVAGGS